MRKKGLNTAVYKKATICLMLPLLVLLFFSCPVKRALNPFINPTTNSESGAGQFSNTNSSISLHLPCCSHAHEKGEEIAILFQTGNHVPSPDFVSILSGFNAFSIPGTTDGLGNVWEGFSFHYATVPVFLRNKAFLI